MEKILQSLKSLYQGEKALERHLWYLVLLILPAITGAFAAFIDKDTPKEFLPVIIVCTCIFAVLSIVPAIFLSGFYYQFLNDRLNGKTGVPAITGNLFKIGLKALPMCICWFIYLCIVIGILMGIFMAPIIIAAISSNSWLILLLLPVMFILLFVGIIAISFLCVFITYISISFSKNFELRGELFNPLTLFYYLKRTFKKTFIESLKYFVVTIVVNSAATILILIVGLILFLFGILLVIQIKSEQTIDIIVAMFVLVFASFATLLNSYCSAMIGLAFSNSLIGVYNELEPKEEN